MAPRRRELTPAQHRFVVEYLRNGRKQGDAYRAAYGRPNMDRHRSTTCGSSLKKNPIVAEHIARADAAAQEEIDAALSSYAVSQKRVALELAHMAFASQENYWRIGADGYPVPDFSKLTPEQWKVLSEVQVEEYMEGRGEDARQIKRVKFRLHDKRQAAMDLAKMLGYTQPEKPDPSQVNNFNGPTILIQFGDEEPQPMRDVTPQPLQVVQP